ncbi:short-chain dehydrogenase [Aspergillus ustus]|uniref:Short-chain dehydrogenase n=1 Tax=Aspergillus ustus TaxID=40382 RepID=A0A0C1EFA7_ASPUT|nr:short-chain dehydrogenase [Aspergillus ustus]
MVSLQTVQHANAGIAALPSGLVALFMGATSGIGQSTLQHFAGHAPSSRIYSIARPSSVASHESFLSTLRDANSSVTTNLITADVSLISEIDRLVDDLKQTESKIDIVFLSAGFMAFEGRHDTKEGLDPSMSTRYYSRLRLITQLLPLLNNPAAPSPRIVSVLAGGLEGPLNEADLDLRGPGAWSFWNASVHAGTMGTLALERVARQNPRLSITHWFPGPVATPGLKRANAFGMRPPNPASQDEAGQRGATIATNDRYAVSGAEGLVPRPQGLGPVKTSGGGIFLVDPNGESSSNEGLLAGFRERGVDETVWRFTEEIFAAATKAGRG